MDNNERASVTGEYFDRLLEALTEVNFLWWNFGGSERLLLLSLTQSFRSRDHMFGKDLDGARVSGVLEAVDRMIETEVCEFAKLFD